MKHSFWWKKAAVFAGVSGLAVGTANADITYNFTGAVYAGFNFSQIFAPGTVVGTLTAVSVNATPTTCPFTLIRACLVPAVYFRSAGFLVLEPLNGPFG
jgi:hypothetical protein